jgi:hypothetical protein
MKNYILGFSPNYGTMLLDDFNELRLYKVLNF